MHQFPQVLMCLLLSYTINAQDSPDSAKVFKNLSNRLPVTMLIAEGGCFSRQEISVTLSKEKIGFTYRIWTSLWNSDDKKRYRHYQKQRAAEAQLAAFLQIENEYRNVKAEQDSLGRILYLGGEQHYTYVVLGKGKSGQRIEDSECKVNGLDRLKEIFGFKEQ